MINNKSILAIIPARGGSKGIPRKNIKLLNGKPLIAYTIEEALKSKYIDRIVVSTEDEEIASVSKSYGAEVPFLRPKELAKDDTPTIDSILYNVNELKEKFDYICLLQCTSPLRQATQIDEAIELSSKKDGDSVVSVCESEVNPYWMKKIENDKMIDFVYNSPNYTRRQDIPMIYRLNGAIYICKTESLLKNKSWYSKVTVPFIMDRITSVDIDDIVDFKFAEYLIKEKNMFNNKCLIIAEAGVNHNGDINIAKQLVDAALEAGVDAIKFQSFKAENLVTKNAPKADYQKQTTGNGNQYEMLKKLELSYDEHIILKNYSEEKGIMFISTPFDFESVDLLEKLDIPLYKISSGDLTNTPLLKYIAKLNKPMIVSTGMANLGEVEIAVAAIKETGNDKISLLHCTSNYPTYYEDVNLNAMITLKNAFKLPIGYSDHTIGIEIPIAAVAMGAKIIEKHFTMDKAMEGPDHKASLNPEELKEMVKSIRNIEKAFGDGVKRCNESEKSTQNVARKSIVASVNIKKGEIISYDNITFKRPGYGISPMFSCEVIGKTTIADITADDFITFNNIK